MGRVLRRIEATVRAWPGEKLDDLGCLRVVNRSAGGEPIFWIYNSVGEYPAFAAQLGDGRPLVGMRSLNQIVPRSDRDETPVRRDLARHYADCLLRAFGTGPCIVGGNCQAAEIAYELILHLLAAGTKVRCFVTVDAEWRVPLPVPVRMLFGRDSSFNPYHALPPGRLEPRERLWSVAFPSVEVAFINGGHGQYFLPENIATLVRQVCRADEQAASVGGTDRIKVALRSQEDGGQVIVLSGSDPGALMHGLSLVPVTAAGHAIPHVDLPGVEMGVQPDWIDEQAHFRLPAVRSRNVRIVPCFKGIGPLI